MNDQKTAKPWIRVLMLLSVIGAACLLLSVPGYAQLTNHMTVAKFSVPFEVPGSNPQVLPAGTYTFKILESQVSNNIVQISDESDTHVFTTVLAIPIHRETEPEKTIMTFDERGAGQPQAIRAWFYPHEKNGQEFVYSKSRASELAKGSKSGVPYSESAVNTTASRSEKKPDLDDRKSSATSVASAPAAPAPIRLMQANGQSTEREPFTQIAQAEPARTTSSQAATQQSPAQNASLPNTAGNSPLYALLGCLMLAGGLSIKRLCGR